MKLSDIILRGTLAARPAAGTLPNGSLYASTDTNEIYVIISAAWQLYVDGDGGGGAPAGADKASQYNNAGALGGVAVNATATKKYLQQVSSGTPSMEQVAAADVTGLAASATVDATNASNISSGTLPIARIADGSVTKAKIENIAADKILGRGNGGGAGAPQELTLGTNLSMTGTTLNAASGTNNPGGADKNIQYNDAGSFGGVSNNATATNKFLRQVSGGTPSMEQVTDADLSTSDITTNNVSTSKHGFAPKAPNDATKYLDGTGAYSTPAGGGGGSVWTAYGPSSLVAAPPTTGWSWDNQGNAVVTEPTAYATNLMTLAAALDNNLKVRYRTAPTPPYVLTALLHVNARISAAYTRFGLLWRQSSDGKLAGAVVQGDNDPILLGSWKYNSSTSFNAAYDNYTLGNQSWARGIWLKLEDDNTNRKISFSYDGFTWLQIHSVTRTDFLTPDQIAWFIQNESGPYIATNLVSWATA